VPSTLLRAVGQRFFNKFSHSAEDYSDVRPMSVAPVEAPA
jgi:hypothetical protein